ncbi:unnamed protein product [Adineta ricciae]|uniref:Uncharacterized protein n=1 Tax=Adineta ricciae TaxID=249248 RepID=A0A814BCC3_ADIRI|nr:unnamed protein product [Adineta ricciae]
MVASKKFSRQRSNEKYRRKTQLKRLQSKVFNAKFKADQNSRQRKCRQRKKEAQTETASATMLPSAQTGLRTVEGAKRRRANTKKLRDENEKLLKEVKKLKNENAEMKKILSEQRLGITNTVDTTPALSPTKLLIGNVSPAVKRRAKRRLLDEKENLPRGSVSKLKKLGINLSNNYISSSSTPSTLQK